MKNMADDRPGSGRLVACFQGNSGTGKSVMAHAFPGVSYTMDFDGGMASIESAVSRGHITKPADHILWDTIGFDKGKNDTPAVIKALDLLGKALDERPDIECIIVDSLTTMAESAVLHGLKEADKAGASKTFQNLPVGKLSGIAPALQDYTYIGVAQKKFLQILLDTGRSVIFIVHTVVKQDDTGKVIGIYPSLVGNLAKDFLPLVIDEYWTFDIKTVLGQSAQTYGFNTQKVGKLYAKSRVGCLDTFEPSNFPSIITKVAQATGLKPEEVWRPALSESTL